MPTHSAPQLYVANSSCFLLRMHIRDVDAHQRSTTTKSFDSTLSKKGMCVKSESRICDRSEFYRQQAINAETIATDTHSHWPRRASTCSSSLGSSATKCVIYTLRCSFLHAPLRSRRHVTPLNGDIEWQLKHPFDIVCCPPRLRRPPAVRQRVQLFVVAFRAVVTFSSGVETSRANDMRATVLTRNNLRAIASARCTCVAPRVHK